MIDYSDAEISRNDNIARELSLSRRFSFETIKRTSEVGVINFGDFPASGQVRQKVYWIRSDGVSKEGQAVSFQIMNVTSGVQRLRTVPGEELRAGRRRPCRPGSEKG